MRLSTGKLVTGQRGVSRLQTPAGFRPAHLLAPGLRIDRLLLHAMTLLVLIVPIDGFDTLTETLGVSLAKLIGYFLAVVLATRLASVVKHQAPTFWIWVAVFSLGTFALVLAESSLSPEFGTLWQMLGLMSLTTAAASTQEGSTRLKKALVWGLLLCTSAYIGMYLIGFQVYVVIFRCVGVGVYYNIQVSLVGVC
jgi:hypothetical protein